MKIFAIVFCACLLFTSSLFAQMTCPPFWSEIQQFRKSDSVQMPSKGAILFVGSSSFTKWTDVQDYFQGYNIINRGFGGSHLTDVIRYAYDVILPYAPKQVVVYCGENDLADEASLTATQAATRFKTLFGIIRQNLPNAVIDFVSIKPSISRRKFFPKFRDANRQIEAFVKSQKQAHFINVYNAMLGSDGEPRKDIFVEDNLHMNKTGYAIWKRIFLPYLKK